MFDLKIDKGLIFGNEYIYISQDNMYFSEYTKDILIKKFGDKRGHLKLNSPDRRQYTLVFNQLEQKPKEYGVHISCGDYCYPNYYRNKNLTIGVMRRRWAIKQVINMCKETTIGRNYKLDKLLTM